MTASGRTSLTIVLALGAALMFAVGNVLEQHEAELEPAAGSLRPGLLARLARRPLWLLGITGDVGAYALQAAALALGSLVFVQPLLVSGLLFALPLGAAWAGRRMTRRDWLAASAIAVGLTVFMIEAAPKAGADTASLGRWAVVGIVAGTLLVLVLTFALRVRRNARALLLGVATGLTFGVAAALTKAFVHYLGDGPVAVVTHWEPYMLGVLSFAGILFTQSAYNAGSLAAALPAIESGEPVTAVVIGMWLLHERIQEHGALGLVIIAASVAVLVLGVVALSRLSGGIADENRAAHRAMAPTIDPVGAEPDDR